MNPSTHEASSKQKHGQLSSEANDEETLEIVRTAASLSLC